MLPNKAKPTEIISDWTIRMRSLGLDEMASSLETSRFDDDRRVRESGLPCYEKMDVPYSQFSPSNEKLMEFFSRYPEFIIRALPPPEKNLPRRPRLGLKSFEDSKEFLESLFGPGGELHGNAQHYTISITEYEPANRGGIIISTPEKTIIEISDQGLEALSHGKITDARHGTFAFHDFNYFQSMRYLGRNRLEEVSIEDREFMWRTLQYIRVNPKPDGLTDSDTFPDISFWTGYFELIRTDNTKRTIFWDYKLAKGYLHMP